ncbi:MAG: HigA family addiction module antidote protein [Chloroflexi bacterium]|nr:HigA family addiction module antidote protein [Chloroflexota bacterium]
MLPENRIPTHPGEVLEEEFLKPLHLPTAQFARHIGLPTLVVNQIVRGQRAVTPEIAWRFAFALGTTPELWLNLQNAHDLALTQPKRHIARLKHAA